MGLVLLVLAIALIFGALGFATHALWIVSPSLSYSPGSSRRPSPESHELVGEPAGTDVTR
jgi:hypothetical protein